MITDWTRGQLFTMENEGFRSLAYWDPIGKCWTCGYGCTGAGIGPSTRWTQEQGYTAFGNKYTEAFSDAALAVGPTTFVDLYEARQAALVDMAYELGRTSLLKFIGMLGAIRAAQWGTVVSEAQNSRWSEQVPGRASRVEAMFMSGQFQT